LGEKNKERTNSHRSTKVSDDGHKTVLAGLGITKGGFGLLCKEHQD
jgi:hypothetical protein